MFTIETIETEYPCMELAIAAARMLMIKARRSVLIYKDGELVRLLRY